MNANLLVFGMTAKIFIRDLSRTQAFWNVVPSSSISWGFISLTIPKGSCSEPCLRFFFSPSVAFSSAPRGSLLPLLLRLCPGWPGTWPASLALWQKLGSTCRVSAGAQDGSGMSFVLFGRSRWQPVSHGGACLLGLLLLFVCLGYFF